MAKDDDRIEGLEDDENLFPDEEDFNLDEALDFDEGQETADKATSKPEQGETSPVASAADKPKSKMLPMLIGVVLVGFIGYKLYDLLIGPTGPSDEVQIARKAPSVPGARTTAPSSLSIKDKLSKEQLAALTDPNKRQPKSLTQPKDATKAAPDSTEQTADAAKQLQQPPADKQDLTPLKPTKDKSPFESLQAQPVAPKTPAAETLAVLEREVFQTNQKQLSKFESQVNESLKSMDDKLKSSEEDLEQVNKSVTTLDKKVDTIGKGLGKVLAQMNKLQGSITQLNKNLGSIKHEPQRQHSKPHGFESSHPREKMAHKSKPKKKARISHGFKIEAVIPGRAWLKNKDGKTITISEGDQLSDLGRVIIIDAYKSAVVTSSGIVIR